MFRNPDVLLWLHSFILDRFSEGLWCLEVFLLNIEQFERCLADSNLLALDGVVRIR